MASTLLNRLGLAALAGLSFGGKRKLYEVFGYPQALSFQQLYVKYQRQDLATRIVDMPPEETWTHPPTVVLPTSNEVWKDFTRRVGLWDRITQADRLCCFGRFSLLWIGLPGVQNTPAPKLKGVEDILYLQAYGGDNVSIKAFERDKTNPRFGQPLLYEITVGSDETGGQSRIQVHYSRVVHVVDRPVQGLISSEPRLAQVYNLLEDILKVGGGSAELYWLTANRGMQVDVDKEMELDTADAAALADELDEFQHQLRRFIRTRGVKINSLGGEVADPRGVFSVLISLLAGATSIPQRILIGSEAGQLASEQDRANWATYIERRRKNFAEPWVLKPTLQKLENLGLLKEGEATKATFTWPEAFQTNPIEESNIRKHDADALSKYVSRGKDGNPLITDKEARRRLGFPEVIPEGDSLPSNTSVPPSPTETAPKKGTESSAS